jgi:hypothetical protein
MFIEKPILLMFETDGKIMCLVYPEGSDHRVYGLLICDAVRHVARAFKVREEDVWEWVDKERAKPTAEVTGELVVPGGIQ